MAERSDLKLITLSAEEKMCRVNNFKLMVVKNQDSNLWEAILDTQPIHMGLDENDVIEAGCDALLDKLNSKNRFCIVQIPSFQSVVWHDKHRADYLDFDSEAITFGLKLCVYRRKDEKTYNVMVVDSDNDLIGEVALEKNFRKESSAKRAAFNVARDYRYAQLGEMGA